MKNFYPVILLFSIAGCSPSPLEQAILDFEQVIDGTKTDLAMEIKSLKKIEPLTFSDSAKILADSLQVSSEREIDAARRRIDKFTILIREQLLIMTEATLKARAEQAEKTANKYKSIIDSDYKRIEIYQSADYENTALAGTYKKLKRFEASPDSVLADKYECIYTIKNPLLNYAEQELHKVYFITPEGIVFHSQKIEAK